MLAIVFILLLLTASGLSKELASEEIWSNYFDLFHGHLSATFKSQFSLKIADYNVPVNPKEADYTPQIILSCSNYKMGENLGKQKIISIFIINKSMKNLHYQKIK